MSDDTTSASNSSKPNKILIEILSCWDLLKGDLRSSDPYVKIKIGSVDVHETKPVKKTLEPVFTIQHDSMFCLEGAQLEDLQKNDGMILKVKDWDPVGSNDTLGTVQVSASQVINAKAGERMEFELQPPKGKKKAGFIAISCRPVMTQQDEQLLEQVLAPADTKSQKKFGFKSALSGFNTEKKERKSGLFTKNEKTDKATGETLYRIRPGPDPSNSEETEWLTEPQIARQSQNPSTKWLDIGSGTLGKVHLEILGCTGLPDKDKGLSKKNKTDSFCAIVYEDCMAKTDVIDDCLSPKWMPWMKRAFILRMEHTSSPLSIAIFDSDSGPLAKHDVIGKVTINLSTFTAQTIYNLEYKIYENSKVGTPQDREANAKGTIQLRLQIEYQDHRAVLLSTVQSNLIPPTISVNVDNKADYRMVRKALQGTHDTRKYDMDTLKSYVEELKSLQVLQFYITDAILNVIFWKGQQFPISNSISIPIHSMTAFLMGIWLVEHPSYAPSMFFWCIAWFMLATQQYRTRNVINPWWSKHSKSFGDFVKVLLLDGTPSCTIDPHENEKLMLEYEEQWNKRMEESQKLAQLKAEEAMREQEEYEKLMQEMDLNPEEEAAEAAAAASSPASKMKSGGFSLLKPLLYPIQQNLAMLCESIRVVRNIVLWEECYYSFWLTAGCIALGLVFLIVPWIFILRWTSRIVVWIGLGPWMYLVDKFYLQKLEKAQPETLTKEEEEKAEQKRLEAKIELAKLQEKDARQKREEALKQKDMKAALFGNYETRIPVIQTDRYYDLPLPTSSAVPISQKKEIEGDKSRGAPTTTVERIGGQSLPPLMMSTSDKQKEE